VVGGVGAALRATLPNRRMEVASGELFERVAMLGRSVPLKSSGPTVRAGRRAYAVGDIHGRLDLLDHLLQRIEADNASRPHARVTIVFLGDLIDRGPQSAQVVERLRRYRPNFAKTIFLMGNHEEVLLRILSGETSLLADWLRFGGAECARSYGIDPKQLETLGKASGLKLLHQAIPKEHAKFLASFVDTASFGSYLFVHAGIRPGVPLSHQQPQDLRWIRMPFLDDEADHGCVVVHGHTITEAVDERKNRIGVDTGAYRTGVLTALGVEANERWFLQTGSQKFHSTRASAIDHVGTPALSTGLTLRLTPRRWASKAMMPPKRFVEVVLGEMREPFRVGDYVLLIIVGLVIAYAVWTTFNGA
jgi:serine/threonine protein phosphatase 1